MGALLAHDASQAADVDSPRSTQAVGDKCLVAVQGQDLNDSLARDQGDCVLRVELRCLHFVFLVAVDCVCHCLIITLIGCIARLS